MRRRLALFAATMLAAAPAVAQVPKERLMQPPADARKFAIISAAGQHGTSALWTGPDGSQRTRESILLRGMVWEVDEVIGFGPDGRWNNVAVRGITPSGDAGETFALANGRARWKSQVDGGERADDGKSWYLPQGGTWVSNATFAEKLHAQPGRRMALWPSGEARMTRLVDAQIGKGAAAMTVTAWSIEGLGLTPTPVWLDSSGKFFGFVFGMAVLPPEHAGEFLALQKVQTDALAKRGPAMVARFGAVSPVPVAFTDVRMFDSERAVFVPGQTVVADKGRIVAAGPAGSVRVPANAKVIAGAGKTLVPGLWDAHMHVGEDAQGLMLLSMGETSARDPGADIAPTIARKARIAKGELLFPTVYSSVLIDGKGPLAAQGGFAVTSADEAIKGVRMAKENGFTGVKFYTSMKKEWLLPAVVEAHRLGLHVHGHIPATMRPVEAIAAGYDEITHINFVMMQAMPDSVVNVSNGIQRFQGPGRYAKDVDVTAGPFPALLKTMAEKKIVVDPTLAVFEQTFTQENGQVSGAYAPFVGTMPPTTERGFRQGGDLLPEGVTRADYRASYAKMVALVAELHKAGVPIVAGTDGSGLEIVRELELYVRAGLTPAQALQTATIVPARLVGADGTTGSITVGKQADLVLVDGDPSVEIGALRRTDWVMSDGKLMNADELRAAAGFTGRPK